MVEFGPAPSDTALETELAEWEQSHDTRQRVKQVMVGIREPTPASTVAERARCSPNTARKHLRELVDERIVLKVDGPQGTRYHRNDEYFAWRRAHQLSVTHTEEDLLSHLEGLGDRDQEFRDRFKAATPTDVDFPPDDISHDDLHGLWEDLTAWANVRRDVALIRDAIRLAHKRGEEPLSAD